jgi:CRISPR system Cascade subunit CasB
MSDSPAEKPAVFRPAPKHLAKSVDASCARIAAMSTGDRSALRKLTPDALHHPAFWKLTTSVLQPALPVDEHTRAFAEQRWAVVIAVAAAAQHSPATRLGSALARAEVSEVRLTRLLRARGEQLPDAVRTLAHQLVAAAVPFDLADLAWLVLSEDRGDEDRARQQIARDYYRAVAPSTETP